MPLPLLAIPAAEWILSGALISITAGMGVRFVGNSVDDAAKKTSGAVLIAAGAAGLTYYLLNKKK